MLLNQSPQSNLVILNFTKLSAFSVCWHCSGGLAVLHWSYLFCSAPCCAGKGQSTLLQRAGFLRPMKIHLALAPEYINVMKIGFIAHHLRVRTILLETQLFYTPCSSLWLISRECIFDGFPFLFHVICWSSRKNKCFVEKPGLSMW